MSQKKIFVTGISTDVGKTIASAILVEALQADYWKPVQAGDLHYSDTHKVQGYVSNKKSVFYPNSYALNTPMSPHESARLDGVKVKLNEIKKPETKNHLIIEGAGGLLVPLNDSDTILDIIKSDYKVVVVSRHYLGSINHTLMTIQLLQQKGFDVVLLYSGDKHKSTESIIEKMTGIEVIGRIEDEPYFDKNVIKEYAEKFRGKL